MLQPARLRVVPLSVQVPEGRVGYVQGSGDTVADDLSHLGMLVEPFDDEALRGADLSRYRAIVVESGFVPRDRLEAAGPDALFSSLADLGAVMRALGLGED